MSDSWWAKKLGGAAPPSRAPQYAPQYTPQVPAREAYTPQPTRFDPANPIESMAQWRGGDGTRKETERCPHCGGDHFFSNQNINPLAGGGTGAGGRLITQNGVQTVAPRCWDCGYTTAHGLQTGSM